MMASSSIYITYLEREGPFVKLWGQTDKHLSIAIEKALQQMTPQFEQGQCMLRTEDLQNGMLCCAKFENEYYRARVINVTANLNAIEVIFIDYGNKDIVSLPNIRGINTLATNLISIPQQATEFIFAGVTCHGNFWDQRVFELIGDEIRYIDAQFQVVTRFGNVPFIAININGQDAATTLVGKGIVVPIAVPTQVSILQNACKTLQAPQPQLVQKPALLTYKSIPFEVGSAHEIYISYISDGPCLFSVQLKNMQEKLQQLMNEINSIELQCLEESPLPGCVCLARSNEDNYICRAVVTNMVDGDFKVFYVDYGNTETLPFTRLFVIPFKYVIYKVMATRFALAGLSNIVVTLDMKCAFKNFVNDKTLYMRVMPREEKSALSRCELYDENRLNLLDYIKMCALKSYPEKTTVTRGITQKIKVSYVYSCKRFFIQLKSKEEDLNGLMQSLQKICASQPIADEDNLEISAPCNALYEADGMFYRAEILEVTDNKVKVKYVDYGNEEFVLKGNLKAPQFETVTSLRPQAIECCLNGYQNMETDTKRDTLLEELILEQDFNMKVVDTQNDVVLVDLFDSEQFNVASLLLEKIAKNNAQASPVLVSNNATVEFRRKSTTPSPSDNRNGDNRFDNKFNDRRSNVNNRLNFRDRTNRFSPDSEDKFSRNSGFKQFSPESENKSFNRNSGFKQFSPESENKSFNRNSGFKQFNPESENKSFNRNSGFKQFSPESENKSFNRNSGFRQDKANRSFNQSDDDYQSKRRSPRSDNTFGNKRFSRNDNETNSSNPRFNRNENNNDFGQNRRFNRNSESNTYASKRSNNRSEDECSTDSKNRFRSDNPRYDKPKFNRSYDENKGFDKESRFNSDRNQDRPARRFDNHQPIDPVEEGTVYMESDLTGTTQQVTISWFHDPQNFYCQIIDQQNEFSKMMKDMQYFYKKQNTSSANVGAAIIAKFPQDNAFYRATIMEIIGANYKVLYVDFGNTSMTGSIYALDKKFNLMPAQCVHCSLNEVSPAGENWPSADQLSHIFDKDSFECTFIAKDDKTNYVDLSYMSDNVKEQLINSGFAAQTVLPYADFEPQLLLSQHVKCRLENVVDGNNINLQIQPGLFLDAFLYAANKLSSNCKETLEANANNFVIITVNNVVENKLEVTLYNINGDIIEVYENYEEITKSIMPVCPHLVISNKLHGFVVYATEKSIFVQPSFYLESIDYLLQGMYTYYDALEVTEIQPEIGRIYAALSSDANWYRAIVASVNENICHVQYIDYGNWEDVEIINIRNLAEDFYDPFALAIEVFIENAETYLNQTVSLVLSKGEEGWCGTSVDVPEISQTVETQPEYQPEHVPETQTEIAAAINDGNVEDVPVDVPVDVPETQIRELNVTSPIEEPVSLGFNVVLSHFDNPSEFYLQLSDSLNAINELHNKLQEEAPEWPFIETVTTGILCAAQYSVDQLWYRAQVLDTDCDIITVRFTDYGNTDVLANESSNVKTLPPEFLALETYAKRCSFYLQPLETEWPSNVCEKVSSLMQNENLLIKIICENEKTAYVDMLVKDIDVAKLLKDERMAVDLVLETATTNNCYISHMNSPSEFWIQLESACNDLEFVAEQLKSAETFPQLQDNAPGALCAAIYEDDCWYRARILSNTVAGVEVLFIDYGNSCSRSNMRELPEELLIIPPLAQKCSLLKPSGVLEWAPSAGKSFQEISADGQTVFTVQKVSQGETTVVQLFDGEDDISLRLLPETFNAYITNINSLNSFHISTIENKEQLQNIEKQLETAYDVSAIDNADTQAVALYKDKWLRANILNRNSDNVELYFIDIGVTDNVAIDSLRKLPDDLKDIPALAMPCKLLPPPGFVWSDNSEHIFLEIIKTDNTEYFIENIKDDIVNIYIDFKDIRLSLDCIKISPSSSIHSTPRKEAKEISSSLIDIKEEIIAVEPPEPFIYQLEPSIEHVEPTVDQPKSTIDQPESTINQPEPHLDQPEDNVDQSEQSVDINSEVGTLLNSQMEIIKVDGQPEPSVDQTEKSCDQREEFVDQSKEFVEQPEKSVDHPKQSANMKSEVEITQVDCQPAPSIDQSEKSCDQPEEFVVESKECVEQPEKSADQTEESVDQPKQSADMKPKVGTIINSQIEVKHALDKIIDNAINNCEEVAVIEEEQ